MKLNRSDINTKEYWDKNYRKGERGGWWKMDKPTGSISTYMSKEIEQAIEANKEAKLIEIGGGTGLGGQRILADHPKIKVYNVDISPYAIEVGTEKYPEITHLCWDANTKSTSLSLANQFDILITQETLEHLKNPQVSLCEMMKLVKLGGCVFIGTPLNEGSTGGAEHIHTFSYEETMRWLFRYTGEVTVCHFSPIGNNLHLGVKFCKTKEVA